MNINEVKVPLKTAINLLEQWGNDERAMELLHAILRDLDAAGLRKCPKCGNEDLALQACYFCGHT